MGVLDNIVTGGITGLAKGAADIIDRFVQTPEEKAQALKELREIEERESKTLLEATHGVIKAEASSEDPYVRRARPTFLYLMYAVIAFNFILVPILHMGIELWGKTPFTPLDIPEELYWLFGSGYLGYAGARTWDKWTARRGK